MNVLRRVVLASASPRRLDLLRSLGLDVAVMPSAYAEPALSGITPRELAVAHARAKLRDVRERLQVQHDTHVDGDLVIAADTVVDVDGVALGKPFDRSDASRMLRALSKREHFVHTAFAIAPPRGGHALVEECESTRVQFFALEEDEIAAYVATGEPLDKAGAYGIQGYGATLVERIDGDFYTVMGLPLARLARAVRRLGFTLRAANGASALT